MPSVDPVINNLLAFSLALLFAFSAAMKFYDLAEFRSALAGYRIVSSFLELPIALAVPIAELGCASLLLITASRVRGAAALMALLCVFSGAIAINLARGRTHIDCGCFGPAGGHRLSGWMLVRNAVIFAAAAVLLLPVSARAILWPDSITIALGVAALMGLNLSASYAIANLPRTRELGAVSR